MTRNTRTQRGFTLVELLVALPVAVIVFSLVLSVGLAGMNLVGRNLSTNIAHLNMLDPIQRLTADIHSSVSDPTLTGAPVNGNFPSVSGTGPAVGLAVETYVAGPFAVHNNSSANNTSIAIELNGANVAILPGMHFRIPSYKDASGAAINKKITRVTSGTYPNLSFDGTLGVTITTQGGTGGGSNGTQIVPVYITVPVNYYVSGTSMIRRDDTGTQTVVLPNVITPSPFSKPDPTNSRFVGIRLGASNSEYSVRNYQSTNFLIDNIWVPSRGQLTP